MADEILMALVLITLSQFCREAQDVMSSAASNYDVNRLVAGIGFAFASVVLAGLAASGGMSLLSLDGLFGFVMTVLYGIMMFASSYVEEEQHFWYWIAGGWIAYLGSFKYVGVSSTEIVRQLTQFRPD